MGWQYVVNYLRQRSNYDRFSLKKYSAETYGQVTDTKIVIVFRLLACNRFSLKKSSCLPNRATKKQNGARFRVDPCLWPANLADLPGATLPKPLQKSRDGLYALSADLFRERDIGVSLGGLPSASVRCHHGAGTGRTKSLCRLHYGVSLPSLCCDLLKLAAATWGAAASRSRSFRSVRGTTFWPAVVTRPPLDSGLSCWPAVMCSCARTRARPSRLR